MKKVKISLKRKLIILCTLLLIIPTITIGISTYSTSKKELTASGKEELQQSTNMVIAMIALLNQEVEAGNLTLEEAQEKLRVELYGKKDADNIRPIKEEYTIRGNGFVYAVDENAVNVMDPRNEGAELMNTETEDGVFIGKELLEAGEKGGYFTYKWMNAKTNKIEGNIAYAQKDPNWGWTVAAKSFEKEFNDGASKVAITTGIIGGLAVIIGIIAAYFFSRRLTKPVIQISHELNRTASGDFSGDDVKVTTNDEIGLLTNDFNTMKSTMKELLSQINQSTEHVAASSEQLTAIADETSKATEEITNSIQLIANGSEESTNSLQESAQSLEEVTLAIQNLAENASEISEASTMITTQAQQGNLYVEQTVQQINSINQKVNESGDVLRLLDSSSNEIGEISKVITDIADQTNLLALNAAIEAARAGEHGKGFAVVAEEVRKLAEQSQRSSKQISNLIKDIQLNMSRSTESMNHVKVEVQDGLNIVSKTDTSFKEIVSELEIMKEKVTDMAATVEEMSASAQEVAATVVNNSHATKEASEHSQRVAATTEEQLAAMQEVSSSTKSLSNLAVELQDLVNKFKM
ncbi:methyl-accepting chemotaxis protein [Viridibacillus arvi]|uniref:methyl-accepting chemotaxis protein n=1 Tax=Viridibacillus arvi TaxID=263475 RepID=UPI00187B2288|nr:methyl-accepting chemotaxis protein [Viridibacillus sp. JNUCC-6]QOV09708.1 cache domain-containing protein [Viridibacillus sp. JNUCC-6]